MIRNFSEEFKNKLKKINDEVVTMPVKQGPEKLFNIHKRSLPPGIDKTVVFYVTKEEANQLMRNKLKTKVMNEGNGSLVYFDLIATDATIEERDVFFNSKPFMIEESL